MHSCAVRLGDQSESSLKLWVPTAQGLGKLEESSHNWPPACLASVTCIGGTRTRNSSAAEGGSIWECGHLQFGSAGTFNFGKLTPSILGN